MMKVAKTTLRSVLCAALFTLGTVSTFAWLIASDVSVSLRRQQATVKKVAPSSNNQGNGYNSYSPNTQYTTDPYSTGAPF